MTYAGGMGTVFTTHITLLDKTLLSIIGLNPILGTRKFNMTENELFESLSFYIDQMLDGDALVASTWRRLDFVGCGEDENFNAYWETRDRSGHWAFSKDEIDPLSLKLVLDQPEKKTHIRDDNVIINTLSHLLDRSPEWIRGFQNGWFGKKNNSASISGYIFGRNLRKKYI